MPCARRRNEIELCARLLGIAAAGLHDNPGLILFTVVAKIIMTLMVLPIFAFLFMAYTNGRITPNGMFSNKPNSLPWSPVVLQALSHVMHAAQMDPSQGILHAAIGM